MVDTCFDVSAVLSPCRGANCSASRRSVSRSSCTTLLALVLTLLVRRGRLTSSPAYVCILDKAVEPRRGGSPAADRASLYQPWTISPRSGLRGAAPSTSPTRCSAMCRSAWCSCPASCPRSSSCGLCRRRRGSSGAWLRSRAWSCTASVGRGYLIRLLACRRWKRTWRTPTGQSSCERLATCCSSRCSSLS